MVCFFYFTECDIISLTSLKITLALLVITYLFFAKKETLYLNSSDLTKPRAARLVSVPMKADISSLE